MTTAARLLNATTFYVVAALGIGLAVVLFTVEVNSDPAIEFGEPQAERSGGVSVVEVRARNTTDETRCPEVRIAARDGDGVDLAEAVAQPVEDDDGLAPGERVVYRARLTEMTDQEYREEFDAYAAYVWEMQECP